MEGVVHGSLFEVGKKKEDVGVFEGYSFTGRHSVLSEDESCLRLVRCRYGGDFGEGGES